MRLGSRIEAEELRSTAETEELTSRIEAEKLKSTAEAEKITYRIEEIEQALPPAAAWAEIAFRSSWSALAPLTAEPTISVVLPTRNRSALLSRSLESVLAQTYGAWELIVVDDASTDDTTSVIESVGDRRVRLIQSNGSGEGHTRNAGLKEASGSIVAFLDDDNLMAPGWLRSVAVAFQERPELNAVYGAQLRSSEQQPPGPPQLLFVSPFDWERLTRANYIDVGVVAHRNGLDGLFFDGALPQLADWDYIVRLAGQFGLDPLPVLASFYTTDAPSRLSRKGPVEALVADLQHRFTEAFGSPGSRNLGL